MAHFFNPNEFPAGYKFIVQIFSTTYIHHEADRRSIEAPGHGYPAHDEPIHQVEQIALKDEKELQEELQRLYTKDKNRKDILVLEINRVVPVGVSVQVDF